MTTATERRITDAAARLARVRTPKRVEKRRDQEYVRSTKALDPDTPLGARVRRG